MLLSALNAMTNRLKKLISKVTIYSIITIIAIATVTSSGSYDLIDRIFIGWRNTSSNILDVRRDSGTAALLILFLTITGIFFRKKIKFLRVIILYCCTNIPFFYRSLFHIPRYKLGTAFLPIYDIGSLPFLLPCSSKEKMTR